MATGNKLSVEIGADITDFQKKIKEVEYDIKELSKVKLEQLKLGLDTKEINAQIKDAKSNLNTLRDSVKGTGHAISKDLTPKVANGSNALMQFSRIAQDAPYGIMGIGNNITATAESFSYLKQQTGSTGGALKALASSLMGTGGILLGVSLLTTGLTLLSQSGLSISDVFNKLTGDFDNFGNAIKKASDKAIESTSGEISTLKQLIFIAQSETISKKERLAAIDEMQKQYPAYFGNLSKEQLMTSDLTGITKELTKALINRAIAANLTEAAVAPTLKLYQANALLLKLKKEQLQAETQLNEAVKRGDSAQSLAFYSNNLKKVNDKLNDTRGVIVQTTNETNRLQEAINTIGATASKLLIKPPTGAGAGKKTPQTFETPQVTGLQSFITPLELTPIIDTTKISTSMKMISGIISEEAANTLLLMAQFNEDASALVEGSLMSTFDNLGTAIGEALASGQNVFSAIGNSLLASIGSFLSEMGGLLIKYGTLAVVKGKLDLAIATGGPVSIGAGLAAIAVGVALKAVGGAIGSKAKGGGQTSTSTGSTANNTSTTSGGTGWSGGANGTVVFEIAGTSLIGVLNNTTERNLRIGGR